MFRRNGYLTFDDSEYRYFASSPVCGGCRHRIGYDELRCAAFPDRIPVTIWNGEFDHLSPIPDDNGIRFEAMTEADRERERQLHDEAIARYRRLTAEMQAKRGHGKVRGVAG